MKTYMLTVFADSKEGGNPCPVTIDADNLSNDEMQNISKEYGLESGFIMKSERPDCDYKLKYFVPLHEMEMCVHATLACATVVKEKLNFKKDVINFETFFGITRVETKRDSKGLHVQIWQFDMDKLDKNPTKKDVATCLNIDEAEIGDMPIASYKTSRYKLIIPLKSRAILDSLKPNFEMLKSLCEKYETSGFYPFAEEKGNYYARQFPKNSGYPEDPATGVAASALGAYILDNKKTKSDGWHLTKIYQGQAMGKPSYIESYNLVKDGKIIENTVCGYAEFIDGSLCRL